MLTIYLQTLFQLLLFSNSFLLLTLEHLNLLLSFCYLLFRVPINYFRSPTMFFISDISDGGSIFIWILSLSCALLSVLSFFELTEYHHHSVTKDIKDLLVWCMSLMTFLFLIELAGLLCIFPIVFLLFLLWWG